MRVITGIARGRKLREPENYDVRPTTDQVKEAIFNIIQFDIEGREVLDLFAGTGQLGIEALSRGAKKAVFVDAAQDSIKIIRENVKATGFEEQAEIVTTSAEMYLKCGRKFDLIFLDPPYDTNLLDISLENVFKFDILRENGIIICESRTERELSVPDKPYFKLREYRYGKIKITTYSR